MLYQSMHQGHYLTMNMAMYQAFDVLQMPISELSDWVEREITYNPLFEITQTYHSNFPSTEITKEPSQREYLSMEIRDHFDSEKERKIATYIGDALNEKGFLTLSIDEICSILCVNKPLVLNVLHIFQRMHPIGLGTHNVQEALLVQLEERGRKGSIIYNIVEQYYDDLLHQHLKKIARVFALNIHSVTSLIYSELRPLMPFPGYFFTSLSNPIIIPDITIEKEGDMWKIEMNERDLPSFQVHSQYLKILEESSLTKKELSYMRRRLAAGQWLHHVINQRQETLKAIIVCILKRQSAFLEGMFHTPSPMTMNEIALALNRSHSTITRAVANKYISCPIGLLKLRTLFTQPLQTDIGVISSKKAQELLIKLVAQEKYPLSDRELSTLLLQNHGISCARRTIAKYRKYLNIPASSERGIWNPP